MQESENPACVRTGNLQDCGRMDADAAFVFAAHVSGGTGSGDTDSAWDTVGGSFPGAMTRFTVTMDGRKPELEGCRLLGGQHGVFEFEVDLSGQSIRALLGRLSQAEGIADVEIRKEPIEQVIAGLCQAWKQ